jgi:hypothetical protein
VATNRSIEAKRRRLERLRRKLGKIGPVLQGTITERVVVRDTRGEAGKRYGPYYQWTTKKHGKTVTVNLARRQAKSFQKAIDNHRELERIVSEMRDLSLEILEQTTAGVQKRARGK